MRKIKVYEVVYHENNDSGAAADGSHVFRTRKVAEAQDFAHGRVCYGSPATVECCEVPSNIVSRWGL